jgi:5-formaminoimidazole-4-carboxamide-1-beta-D-ribofuranosyl 5'-monophosphate synthetase
MSLTRARKKAYTCIAGIIFMTFAVTINMVNAVKATTTSGTVGFFLLGLVILVGLGIYVYDLVKIIKNLTSEKH